MAKIAAIVERDGEVEAVPVLIRRIGLEVSPFSPPIVPRPIRVRRQRILKEGELERYVSLAAGLAGDDGCILILLDANGDCPAEIGPLIQRRARTAGPGCRIEAVLAKCEYEAWLIAAAGPGAAVQPVSHRVSGPPRGARRARSGWLILGWGRLVRDEDLMVYKTDSVLHRWKLSLRRKVAG